MSRRTSISNMFAHQHNSLPPASRSGTSSSKDFERHQQQQAMMQSSYSPQMDSSTQQTPTATTPVISSMAKIIDIGQRMRHLSKPDGSLIGTSEQQPREDQSWNNGQQVSNTLLSGSSASQHQVNELANFSGVASNNTNSSNRGAQKQQSGETLSSFESDYDLLVYLGETETEDIVDTERSLDYQDQTWRQSICGASLAPTIDESLSELTGHQSLIIGNPSNHRAAQQQQQQDYFHDPLSTPTLLSAPHSPFATPSPARSPQLGAVDRRQGPVLLDSDECDREVSQVMHSQHGAPPATVTKPATSQPQTSKIASTTLGDKLVSLFNRKPQQQQEQAIRHNNNPAIEELTNQRRRREDTSGNLNTWQSKSATMGRTLPVAYTPTSSHQQTTNPPGDELDKLLAEMSQSLDLDSLARYDPQPQRQQSFQPDASRQRQSQTLRNYNHGGSQQRYALVNVDDSRAWRNASAAPTRQRDGDVSLVMKDQVAASSESILDEFDGASRMLEQMISDQLKESVANRQRRQRADSFNQGTNSEITSRNESPKSIVTASRGNMADEQQRKPKQVNAQQRQPAILPSQRPQRVNELAKRAESPAAPGDRQGKTTPPTSVAISSRKVSSCSSSVASTVLGPQSFAGRNESGSPTSSRRTRRPSGASIFKPQPPPPPKIDYIVNEDPKITQVEPDELPAASESESESESHQQQQELGRSSVVAVAAKPPPSEGQLMMNRMKQRTLSSMRSMRSKISDLLPGGAASNQQKTHQQRSQQASETEPKRPPRPPKRSSSFSSRHPAVAQPSTALDAEDKESKQVEKRPVDLGPQVRESRSAIRRGKQPQQSQAATEKQSFGQQLRERLSRSKSRFTRLWRPKRSKSQPSGKGSATTVGADEERDEILFGPGDIARNSGSPKVSAKSAKNDSATQPSTPSSFGQSLDRHIAADLAKRRDSPARSAKSPSSSASSSSLSGLDTSAPRSRSRQRAASAAKSPRGQAPRPLSVISLARAKRESQEHAKRNNLAASGGSVSAGCSPAPNRRSKVPTYFGPAYSLANSSERRSSSQDEMLAAANIWEPRVSREKRSQSMKSVRQATPVAALAEDKKTISQAQLHRRLPVASNTFRPASACAKLPIADATSSEAPHKQNNGNKLDVRSLAATPVGLNGAPVGSERQLSLEPVAKPADEQIQEPRNVKSLFKRTKSAAALLDDIKHKCSGLFGAQTPQASRRLPAPVAPPRRHRRSKSLAAVAAQQPEVKVPKPETALNKSGGGGSRRLTQFAQQLKHQTADFFNQPPPNHPSRCIAATKSRSSREQVKASADSGDLCEWKPIIGGSSGEKDTTIMTAKTPTRGEWAKEGTTINRTPATAVGLKRAPTLKEIKKLQSTTFDTTMTDTTWESASNTDADIDQQTTEQSCADFRTDDSSDLVGQASEGQAAGFAGDRSAAHKSFALDRQQQQQQLQRQKQPQLARGVGARNMSRDKNSAESNASASIANNVSDDYDDGDKCEKQQKTPVEFAPPIDHDGKRQLREQQQQQQQQQVAVPDEMHLKNSGSSIDGGKRQHSTKQTLDATPFGADDVERQWNGKCNKRPVDAATSSSNLSQKHQQSVVAECDVDAQHKDRQREDYDDATTARSKQKEEEGIICKTPFKFNADLPLPSDIFPRVKSKNDNANAQTKVNANNKQQAEEQADKDIKSGEDRMAIGGATARGAQVRPTPPPSAKGLSEADERFLRAIRERRAPTNLLPAETTANDDKLDEVAQDESAAKRLSVYENEPMSQQQKQQKVSPPTKPARPSVTKSENENSAANSTARTGDNNNKVPDSPISESWSVGDVDVAWSSRANQATNKSSDKSTPVAEVANSSDRVTTARAAPKRVLMTMTSIIQDPNDELMNAAPIARQVDDSREMNHDSRASDQNQDRSMSNSNNNNNSTDSDSSIAGPLVSANRRLQERFAPPMPKVQLPSDQSRPPKCPAFNDGGRASGGSLVKRLAKNFDQVAAAASEPTASSTSTSRNSSAKVSRLTAIVAHDEEPKSESSQWFDATSGTVSADEDHLDEAELAELLAEFEANDNKSTAISSEVNHQQQQHAVANQLRSQLSTDLSEDVSTGADPFVTVAESTLELAAATDSEANGADDTLNDDDYEDEGADHHLLGRNRSTSPLADEEAEPMGETEAPAATTGEQICIQLTTSIEHQIACQTNPPKTSALNLDPSLPAQQIPARADLSDDNATPADCCYLSGKSDRSCHPDNKDSANESIEQQQQHFQLTNNNNNNNDSTNLYLDSDQSLSPAPPTPQNKTKQSLDSNIKPHPNYHHHLSSTTEHHYNSLSKQSEPLKPIDDSLFKNSLNNIIGRRSSSSSAAATATQHSSRQQQQHQVVGTSDSSSGRSSSSPATEQQPQSQQSKQHVGSRGLARYYRALLGRGKSKRRETQQVQIDNCIHSSSASSASSSSSSSAASSRSSSPIGRQAKVDGARHERKASTGNANSSAELLYEELERMLARRSSLGATSVQLDEEPQQQQQQSNAPLSECDQVSLSSSNGTVSVESIPELRQRQNLQKLYHIVNEIYSSEAKFVDTLKLLNVDFRRHMDQWTNLNGAPGAGPKAAECIQQMLKHLPQLQALNESLLEELGQARDQWPRTRKIAHVLVKIGPFLKHYSTYIREFDAIQQQLNECQRKMPLFADRIKEFESSDRCQKLTLQHHLLRPIQRIPQYRLLLQQYLHHLKPDEVDYEDTVEALEVVSRVAEHANQSMNEGVNFAKLLALQAKIVGKQRDIVQPGRLFVKEGELMKVCRKQVQPRWFVLLNDALLYLTQIQSSDILYLNNELPLDDCLVSTPNANELVGKQFESEFSVQTRTRSFALIAKSRQERDEWVEILRQTISRYQERRRSFQQQQQQHLLLHRSPSSGSLPINPPIDAPQFMSSAIARPSSAYYLPPVAAASASSAAAEAPLGHKAPLWTPDSRVTMCQLCTSSFSALFRRHHCRACGRVVCSACSANKAPLVYLKCRAARVCDQCFEQLKANLHLYYQLAGDSSAELRRLDDHFRALIKGQFQRHGLTRRSSNGSRKHQLGRNSGAGDNNSGVLREVGANDNGSLISGYLHRRHTSKPKWKRQWFVIRERVLYAYRAIDDVAAVSTLPLLGYQADQPTSPVDGLEPTSLLRLTHRHQYPATNSKQSADQHLIQHLFKAESASAAERWLEAFKRSVVFESDQSEVDHDNQLENTK